MLLRSHCCVGVFHSVACDVDAEWYLQHNMCLAVAAVCLGECTGYLARAAYVGQACISDGPHSRYALLLNPAAAAVHQLSQACCCLGGPHMFVSQRALSDTTAAQEYAAFGST